MANTIPSRKADEIRKIASTLPTLVSLQEYIQKDIERMEGMRYKIVPMEEHPIYSYETSKASEYVLKEQAYEEHYRCKKYYNQALNTLIEIKRKELEELNRK